MSPVAFLFTEQTYFPTLSRLQVPPTQLSYVALAIGTTKPLSEVTMATTEPTRTPKTVQFSIDCPTEHENTSGTPVNTSMQPDSITIMSPQIRQENITDTTMPISSDYLRSTTSPTTPASPTLGTPSETIDTWTSGTLTSVRLAKFAQTVLPPEVQTQLAQPFGKDSIHHSFYAEKCFRHILLPLFKSGFLPCRAHKALARAFPHARQLQQLRKRYQHVDFRPLQGYQADWESTTTIRSDWKEMTSACLLHFDGDVATMVRWIGGPHVNAHLDASRVLTLLKPIVD